ncbi:MAG: hypothetical protein ACLRZ6_10285 [Lachnospiraceae bacterium]
MSLIQMQSPLWIALYVEIVIRKENSDTDEALAYIPFRITNNTTGETHYILTDANGNFTSATGKTTNTNATM